MATFRWHGSNFTGIPVEKLPNGDWYVTAMQNGPRFTIGSQVRVTPDEVVEMSAAEIAAATGEGDGTQQV
jgi:hypothetical protein